MSKKRRDSKNRVLRSGESQRKDGRYAYKYIDTFGNPQFVYAWKLVPTDKTPAGKREDISLREKVKEIQKDLDDGIDTIGKKMTVCQLYAKQIRHRGNVRYNTKNGRKRLMKLLEEDKLGGCPIDSVKLSDAKEWAIRMKEKGISYKTISNDKRSLKAAFYTAIQDDCIRKNPFDFQLNTVIEDDTEPKVPLTPAQEESFLSFAQNDKVYQKYYDELIILLGTGLRISELCGIFENSASLKTYLGHDAVVEVPAFVTATVTDELHETEVTREKEIVLKEVVSTPPWLLLAVASSFPSTKSPAVTRS